MALIFSSCETTPTPTTDSGPPSTQTTAAPVQPVDPLNSCPPRGSGSDVKSVLANAKEAVQKKDWQKAQLWFSVANWPLRYDPSILFNRAFIYDQHGDRDLSAIRFYKAYLVAAPRARNAPQVKKRIQEVKAKVRQQAQDLLKSVNEATKSITKDSYTYRQSEIAIIEAFVLLGRTQEALTRVEKLNWLAIDEGYEGIVRARARLEDFSGAFETAEKIIQLKKASSKELRYLYSFKYIAETAALSGNMEFARRSIEKLHVLTKTENELDNRFAFQFLVDSYLAVADRFIQVDKRPEVESALRKAEEAANSIVSDDVDNQAQKYADIILRWTRLGNMTEADRIAQKVFGRGVSQVYLGGLLDDLVRGFLSVGNVPPAKKYYKKIGYENSNQVDNINRIDSALKVVQEAQPKDRSAAEANLKRCQRQLWSWQNVYPDTTRTMVQMEIDAWAKGAEGRVFATEYGIGMQLESLKKQGQKYFVQNAAEQVVNILNDLAHQYRIEMDFKRRRGN